MILVIVTQDAELFVQLVHLLIVVATGGYDVAGNLGIKLLFGFFVCVDDGEAQDKKAP